MNNRRHLSLGLLIATVLGSLLFVGCRAFQPEAVLVNKPPETFIVGAPLQDGGGYYHFHVFWYGSDRDGIVSRFVWALTDTSLQDPDTVADEEDRNFNPALDASTLAIGHWTTRTDSVFSFTIDAGVRPSADMTLHMVAVDDFGDFDRTPARLHFFSNTLGNPEIHFFRIVGADTVPIAPGEADTVGFGSPFQVYWAGTSPNVRGFSPAALAEVDTVFPFDDGLFGYKWQIMGALGGNCLPSLEDCWHPRRFNEATGDSFSFFGSATSLVFENNGSGTNVFHKLLPSGEVHLNINSIDVAGVEVAEHLRPFTFVVNFDPQTKILNGTVDPYHAADPQVYPYYILLNDVAQLKHPFQAGDRIPDRTYVVFKALYRDDPRDARQGLHPGISMAGFMEGTRRNLTGGVFSFRTESSDLDTLPAWGVPVSCDTCWYADTLGFLTGPRTEFTMNMQAVDEHGRRDGSPAALSFEVGFPPGVQCVEVLPSASSVSAWPPTLAWVGNDQSAHPCFQDTTVMRVVQNPLPGDGNLEYQQDMVMLVDKLTYFVQLAQSGVGLEQTNYIIPCRVYNMAVLLHGEDDPREAWSAALRRSLAWQYQINYACDPFNQIKDGGGSDDIRQPTWGEPGDGIGLNIDPGSGLWKLGVVVAVPTQLFLGTATYRSILQFSPNLGAGDPGVAQALLDATTKQFGRGNVQAVVLDQTACGFAPTRPARYVYFKHVRPPLGDLTGGQTWRDCGLVVGDIKDDLSLSRGAMASRDGVPVTKQFRLIVSTNTGDFICGAR